MCYFSCLSALQRWSGAVGVLGDAHSPQQCPFSNPGQTVLLQRHPEGQGQQHKHTPGSTLAKKVLFAYNSRVCVFVFVCSLMAQRVLPAIQRRTKELRAITQITLVPRPSLSPGRLCHQVLNISSGFTLSCAISSNTFWHHMQVLVATLTFLLLINEPVRVNNSS